MSTRTARMGRVIVLALAIVLGLAIAATSGSRSGTAYAADGDLDPTFGIDGRVTTDYIGTSDWGWAVAIQPDGKVVVVGTTQSTGGDADFAVARYNSDGSPDTTFSGDGKLTTDFLGGSSDGAME